MLNEIRYYLKQVPWAWPLKYALKWLGIGLQALWNFKWFRLSIFAVTAFLTLRVVAYTLVLFNVGGLNTEEDGWRAGTLAEYSMSNRMLQWLPPGWFFPTGEGSILLGNSSTHNATLFGRTISPSYFSTSTKMFWDNNSLVTQSVVVHYRKLIHTWSLGGETDVRIEGFEKVAPTTLPSSCSDAHGFGAKKIGVIGGVIVDVAKIGDPFLWKTYEVIIHIGGQEFKEMSIVDADIYDCAIIALKTGKPMKITYDDRLIRDPVSQNTTYNIVGISNEQ